MINRALSLLPMLLVGLLAGLTFWLNEAVQPEAVISKTARHDPDYMVDHLTAKRLDGKGNTKHTLYAERLVHYPDDDSTYLNSPRFITTGSPATLTVTARTATVASKGEQVNFETNVRAVRSAYGNQSELVLSTESLQVNPDEKIAHTHQAVTVSNEHTIARSIGLKLDYANHILTFISAFRGTYYDPKRAPRQP